MEKENQEEKKASEQIEEVKVAVVEDSAEPTLSPSLMLK